MKGNKNRNVAAVVLIVIVVLVVVGVILWRVNGLWGSGYAAVYLRTGDLYFGKLVRFPSFGLKDVYFIQANPQNTQSPLSIQKFSNVFWGPEDHLKLNRNQVVWVADLNEKGQLVQALKQGLNAQGGTGTQPSASQTPQAPAPAAPQPSQDQGGNEE